MTEASRRSSACADARARALLGLASAALLLTSGCGGGPSRRDRVETFLRNANDVQQQSAPAFDRANRAYLAFSKGRLAPQQAQTELLAAEQAIRRTRDQIAALGAPPDARELKRRLVALFDADAAFAHESTLLADFVPASARAMKPLAAVGKRLRARLHGAKKPAVQEAALRSYATSLGRVVARLVPLHPPPLLLERHHAQVEHLRTLRRLALSLANALKAQDSRRVASLLLRFRRLNGSAASQALSRGAVDAYNRRYLAVRNAAQSVERERRRLEIQLGR